MKYKFDKSNCRHLAAIVILQLLYIPTTFSQRTIRYNDDYGSNGGSLFILIIMLISGYLFLRNSNKKGQSNLRNYHSSQDIKIDSIISFGRYALTKDKKIEYPELTIKSGSVFIYSRHDVMESGETNSSITFPVSRIKSVVRSKRTLPYSHRENSSFKDSYTIILNNYELIEFPVNKGNRYAEEKYEVNYKKLLKRIDDNS